VKLVRDAFFKETRRYSEDFKPVQPIPLPLVREPYELNQQEADEAIQASIATGSVPEMGARSDYHEVQAGEQSKAHEGRKNEPYIAYKAETRDRFSAEKRLT
jgi:hypothetical protein